MAIFIDSNSEPTVIKTKGYQPLGLNGQYCKIIINSKQLYFKILRETNTTFYVERLQKDSFDNSKFYETGEINKFHGLVNKDAPLTKGRTIYLLTIL